MDAERPRFTERFAATGSVYFNLFTASARTALEKTMKCRFYLGSEGICQGAAVGRQSGCNQCMCSIRNLSIASAANACAASFGCASWRLTVTWRGSRSWNRGNRSR
jgi:hypothetical protein